MTLISDIDEDVINQNLQIRYSKNQIYVSFLMVFNYKMILTLCVNQVRP